jgi:hypothetical protein
MKFLVSLPVLIKKSYRENYIKITIQKGTLHLHKTKDSGAAFVGYNLMNQFNYRAGLHTLFFVKPTVFFSNNYIFETCSQICRHIY